MSDVKSAGWMDSPTVICDDVCLQSYSLLFIFDKFSVKIFYNGLCYRCLERVRFNLMLKELAGFYEHSL